MLFVDALYLGLLLPPILALVRSGGLSISLVTLLSFDLCLAAICVPDLRAYFFCPLFWYHLASSRFLLSSLSFRYIFFLIINFKSLGKTAIISSEFRFCAQIRLP